MIDKEYLNPAMKLIAAFGGGDVTEGIKEVAIITKRHTSRVTRWMYPEDRGGTDGIIPPCNYLKLEAEGKRRSIEVPKQAFG